ncbi:amino acid adenylation domain-containing protein [Bacillus altitudinis]|uniref:non-ribosomal peptide synthetase n=1 Tax=Bacillus altitudinis TaxID=293387 RepID=UPI00156805DC|nr:non-ribosomal peptide synthetase [Bacillus altitudinis]QKJ38992.1 amino acid adenylation domain-containing protein [Bacillus altitudinis]
MSTVYYPLTHAQKRVFYTERFYPGTSISNLGGFAKLRSVSGLNPSLIVDVLQAYIRETDSLRLRLVYQHEQEEPVQYIKPYEKQPIRLVKGWSEKEVRAWANEEIREPMELIGRSLIEFTVFQISDQECWLFCKAHHIVADGISIILMGNRIIDLYHDMLQGTDISPIEDISFVDHIMSEQTYESSKRFQKDQVFWNEQFANIPDFASLTPHKGYEMSLHAERFSGDIPDALKEKLRVFCEEEKVSMLSMFMSAVYIYLHRFSGMEDVVLGTFMGNRTNAKEKKMIGMFVSTIPMRASVQGSLTFLDFVKQVMADQMKILRHQKYPYNVLMNDLRERDGFTGRLFDISLEYQVMQWQKKENLSFITEPIFSGSGMNDISIHVKDRWDTDTLTIDLDYRTDLFSEDDMSKLFDRLIILLEAAVSQPDQLIGALSLLPADEQKQLLQLSKGEAFDLPGAKPVHHLFDEAAKKYSERAAVVAENGTFTYGELYQKADKLARFLQMKGVSRDVPVAVLMERTADAMVAIFGILKAGGAYVPIDPALPEERIQFIVEDSGASIVLTEESFVQRYSSIAEKMIVQQHMELEDRPLPELIDQTTSQDLAYLIYTSGTTGKPKGVMIEHLQLHHLVHALHHEVYEGANQLQVALLAPFHFDASVKQIFAALLFGHTLHIVPREMTRNGVQLAAYYKEHQIEATDGTPAHVQLLLAVDLDGLALTHMLIGGEALPAKAAQALIEAVRVSQPDFALWNVYGPTETCVDATVHRLDLSELQKSPEQRYVSIGKPLGHHRIYILNEHEQLQVQGAVGELCIAGIGVGRGYVNQPELTEKAFRPDPFSSEDRMYRTGDVVRWLPDGTIDYLGRIDDQVKIRGYRIEIGEIEAVMEQVDGVDQAVVLVVDEPDGGKALSAYYQARQEFLSVDTLQAAIKHQLPAYMMPLYFKQLEAFPLTVSGKVDRRALAALKGDQAVSAVYVAPRNDVETKLVRLWEDVLHQESIGVYDSFFDLGGHSLKAMKVLTLVQRAFQVEVPLSVLFEQQTIAALAVYIEQAEKSSQVVIPKAPTAADYPLSPAQQRVYMVTQLEQSIAYHMPAVVKLRGTLKREKLEAAFGKLIARHDMLRTSFHTVKGVPRQRVASSVPFQIEQVTGSTMEENMRQFVRPFYLEQAPLLRVGLQSLHDQEHLLYFDMHHLISDGLSIDLMLRELSDAYEGSVKAPLKLQYQDYAVWQEQQAEQGGQIDEAFWLKEFSGDIPALQLLTDYQRPAVQSFAGDRVLRNIDETLTGRLQELAANHHTTLYTVLLSAYYTLLAKYTGQKEFVVGTPTAGRVHADLNDMIGMFVQTLALRSEVDPNASMTQLIEQVKEKTMRAFEHQQYPFERLLEKLNVQRDFSRHPLFDTVFTLTPDHSTTQHIGEMKVEVEETNFHIAKFDLTLQATESSHGLSFVLDYSTALFKRSTAEQMLKHYVYLLEQMVEVPEQAIQSYRLLSEQEAAAQLKMWNPLPTPYPAEETIVTQFESQVQQHGHQPALQYKDEVLSYQELNRRVNQLAHYLHEHGFEKGMKAALFFERSNEMVLSVLAVLKAGGVYVPIDPDFPDERIKHFLTDSGAQFVLTHQVLRHRSVLTAFEGKIIETEDQAVDQQSESNPVVCVSPLDLANLTYTSGTTGKPKGNMVTHRNILRTVKQSNYLTIHHEDTVMSLSNYVFDAFMFDVFGALLNGAKLIVLPKDQILNMNELSGAIEKEKVSILMITTALFHLLIDMKKGSLKNVRKVLFGGERASVPHVVAALETVGEDKLIHMYGPSESTIFTTYYPVNHIEEQALSIPIGKPVSQTAVYIVDEFGQVQPPGVAGELCVAGDGLVMGYYHQPELTSEKFVENPFRSGEVMYKTGDLARWLSNGDIEFIGRIDHQVKIRGQRIELGEIEHQLLQHPQVKEAVVIAISNDTLCAYFTAEGAVPLSDLREQAGRELPVYMMPAFFMQLDELPLTGNGKVDRRALPVPDVSEQAANEYVPPQSDTERILAHIWEEVLEVPKIGRHDHFFECGGHSLRGMKMLNRLYEEMHVECTLKTLFESPTLETFALAVDQTDRTEIRRVEKAEEAAFYPVTSAQKRLFVLQKMTDAEQSYHMPAALKLEGVFDEKRFKKAIDQLVHRHEAFRTSFDFVQGEPVQRIETNVSVNIENIEGEGRDIQQLMNDFIRPFDVGKAPLLRVGLVSESESVHYLLIDMHHIISDGASVGILIDELSILYRGDELDELPIQYKDYAVWSKSEESLVKKEAEAAFWLEQLQGELPVLALPEDLPRPKVQTFEGGRVEFSIDGALKAQLDELVRTLNSTTYTVLLACYSTLLSKLSRQEDIMIGSPVVGRTHPDIQSVIGMFVNTLALRTKPEGHQTFSQFASTVHELVLAANEHQLYPFEELVDQVQTVRDTSRHPIFDVVFSMENADIRDLSMDGLDIIPQPFNENIAKFDLTLTGNESDDQIELVFDYNSSIFERSSIEKWKEYFLYLIEQMVSAPDQLLDQMQLLSPAQQQKLLDEWSGPILNVPTDQTVHALIEAKSQEVPHQKAASFCGTSWTYEELNNRANTVAARLMSSGTKLGDRIGILTRPSLEMTAAVLGVLKAGAAFVPIDADYPAQRIAYMLEDGGAEVLLIQKGITAPPSFTGHTLFIEEAVEGEAHEIQVPIKPTDLAYMIYTSGTTGQPKGVMVEHQSLVNLAFWHNDAFQVTKQDRTAKYAGFGFDASIWEMFPTWIAGAELHIIDEAIRLDMIKLNTYFNDEGITIAFLPTQLCEQFMSMDNHSLRYLLTGGDKLKQVKPVPYKLVNNYGPTENTVVATSGIIDPDQGTLPIGTAIANTRFYIMGSLYDLSPQGVPGELVIAGKGLARGYWNLPEETHKRFVPDPFHPGERMYRTGDLVKWTEDGELIYLGRKDDQVNIRGFRIELSEIEAQLLALDSVQEAVVTTVKDASDQDALVAYVITDEEVAILKDSLKRTLPEYMVPSWIIKLDQLPMTANGKVDLKALPAPDMEANQTAYEAPRDEVEALFCGIWEDVLGVSQVGIHDHFFFLGGDSIKGIEMASRLTQEGWKLDMKLLFQYPTIAELRPYIEEADLLTADQSPVEGEVILTPIQRWFFERNFSSQHHWNQSVMLHAANGLDEALVKQVLEQMMTHHDALRLVYPIEEGRIIQRHRGVDENDVAVDVIEVQGERSQQIQQVEKLANEVQASISLTEGPLVKPAIFRTDHGDHLLLVVHHLVIDGVSWRIFLEDFMALYEQAKRGEELTLPEKTHSFQAYAQKLTEYAVSDELLAERDYWKKVLGHLTAPLQKDHVTEDQRMLHTKTIRFTLSEEETRSLLTEVHEAYHTEINDILLTALGLTLKEWTGEDRHFIHLEGHGREDILPAVNVSRTIGWFTSMYPVLLDLSHAEDLSYQIKLLKEELRHISNKGIGYGVLKYLTPDKMKDGLAFDITPDISFNYLGQFDEQIGGGELSRSSWQAGQSISPESEKPHALDIVGFVEQGMFQMTMSYHQLEFEEQTIEQFKDLLEKNVKALISHCVSQDEAQITPSDVGDDDLTMDELEKLMDIF